jgi:hypothetical protein
VSAERLLKSALSPQLLKPGRIGGGVPDGVLNVSMPEIILNEPRIRALISKRKATGMAQYVQMGKEGEGGGLTVRFQSEIGGVRSPHREFTRGHKQRVISRQKLFRPASGRGMRPTFFPTCE